MRIVYVANSFLEKNKPTTGLPMYLYKVSKALIKMGHKPIIVAGGEFTKLSYVDEIEVHTIEVYHNPHDNNIIINAKDILLTSYRLNQEVKRIHKKSPIDIIQYASPFGLGIFYNFNIPAVIRLSWYAKLYFYPYVTYTKEQVDLFTCMEKLQARKATGIFGPGSVIAKEYGKDTKRKVTIIETPFENEELEIDYSVYNDKLHEKKYILFFGSLLAEKGIFTIQKIIYRFLKNYPDYYYVFAGENVEYSGRYAIEYIREEAKENRSRVIYLGKLERSKLFGVIQKAEMVTLPSVMENFANACVEAMALGKIVVGTDGATYEQLIDDGVSGFLAKPGDAATLYHAIQTGIELDEQKKQSMYKAAIKRTEKLRPEITVKKLLQYYDYIINKYNGRMKK